VHSETDASLVLATDGEVLVLATVGRDVLFVAM